MLSRSLKYSNATLHVEPYTKNLAAIYDGLLGHLYLRTKQDGLLETAFPGLPEINFDKFVSYLTGPKVALQIYYADFVPGEATPVGYCFLFNIDGQPGERMAEFGFCFFKEYWGEKLVVELGWQCIDYWFEKLEVDVLYGATRADNRMASIYCRKFGFEEMAVLPKFLRGQNGRIDARIVMLEKERFFPLLEQHWK